MSRDVAVLRSSRPEQAGSLGPFTLMSCGLEGHLLPTEAAQTLQEAWPGWGFPFLQLSKDASP